MNIAAALRLHAIARPTHTALIEGDRTVTYAELYALVQGAAGGLLSQGVGAGDLVGVALGDDISLLVALYGLAALGAIALPMDWRWTLPEQQRVVDRFPTRGMLAKEAAALPGGVRALHHRPAPLDVPFADGDNLPLLVSLSSGTTGVPKGPVVTHRQFHSRFQAHWINLGLNAGARYIAATPLYFGAGRTFAMSVLYSGGTVILHPPPYQPGDLVDAIARHDANSVFLVPTQLRRLLEHGAALPSLRLLLSSGSPLHVDERREIRSRLTPWLFETYATTEGGGVSLLTPDEMEAHGHTVGRALFGVEIGIVDPAGDPLPPGEAGLLRYRGPGVATRMLGDPPDSKTALRDGWFHPGDVASLDRDGYLTLLGRRQDIILRGGINVYPAEIEAVLLQHPAVADVAVIGRDAGDLGSEPVAFVVLRADPDEAEPDEAALAAFAATRLAHYKLPRRYVTLAELPRNAGGKVVRSALAAHLV